MWGRARCPGCVSCATSAPARSPALSHPDPPGHAQWPCLEPLSRANRRYALVPLVRHGCRCANRTGSSACLRGQRRVVHRQRALALKDLQWRGLRRGDGWRSVRRTATKHAVTPGLEAVERSPGTGKVQLPRSESGFTVSDEHSVDLCPEPLYLRRGLGPSGAIPGRTGLVAGRGLRRALGVGGWQGRTRRTGCGCDRRWRGASLSIRSLSGWARSHASTGSWASVPAPSLAPGSQA